MVSIVPTVSPNIMVTARETPKNIL